MVTSKKKSVWETLSQIDCRQHSEEKNGLTYLSWTWAYAILMEHYPDASFEFQSFDGSDILYYNDGTGSVHCSITVDGKTKSMWLAVMDYRNKAISNPPAHAISNAKMRCLTKCMAMFGLGHYIYAGEDLPQNLSVQTQKTDEEKEVELMKMFKAASQLTKLESIVRKQPYNAWITSLKKSDEARYMRIFEQYDLREKKLTEGIKSNGQ